MHHRFRPLAAIAGALVLFTPLSAGVAAAAPPEDAPRSQDHPVEVDITVEELDGRHLVGTVACDPEESIRLRASIEQEGDPLPVSANGETDEFECGPDPVPFRMEMRGDDVLVPGTATYEIYAYPAHRIQGELTLTDEVDLGEAAPPDFGPFPIHIDPEAGVSADSPLITGTITCDEPEEVLFLNVDGWQMAGRYRLEFDAFAHVPCEGETPFAIPIASDRGGLVPGPATVTVTGPWGAAPDRHSGKTVEVQLRSSTPEPDFRPEPQPDTSIRFGRVVRVNGQLVGSVYTGPCLEREQEVGLIAYIRPAGVRADERWFNPGELAQQASAPWEVPCTGGEQPHLITLPDGYESDEVVVEVTRYILHADREGGNIIEETQNAATFTVSTK